MTKYRSGLEERVADLLSGLGITFEYESHKLAYTIQHLYCPDFTLPNGVILETKGYWEPEDRRKILAVKKDNPDVDIRMCFQNPHQKLSKTAKMTYAVWCDKHNIPWCRGPRLPRRWTLL